MKTFDWNRPSTPVVLYSQWVTVQRNQLYIRFKESLDDGFIIETCTYLFAKGAVNLASYQIFYRQEVPITRDGAIRAKGIKVVDTRGIDRYGVFLSYRR